MEIETSMDITVQCTECGRDIDDEDDIYCTDCATTAMCDHCEDGIATDSEEVICKTCYNLLEENVRDELVEVNDHLECIQSALQELAQQVKNITCRMAKQLPKKPAEKKKNEKGRRKRKR